MEVCDRISQQSNGRKLLLKTLRQEIESEKNHGKIIALQKRVDEIVAQNFLYYITGSRL